MYQEFPKYLIELNTHQLETLNGLLMNAPFRVAAPMIESINRQIAAQDAEREKGPA